MAREMGKDLLRRLFVMHDQLSCVNRIGNAVCQYFSCSNPKANCDNCSCGVYENTIEAVKDIKAMLEEAGVDIYG